MFDKDGRNMFKDKTERAVSNISVDSFGGMVAAAIMCRHPLGIVRSAHAQCLENDLRTGHWPRTRSQWDDRPS